MLLHMIHAGIFENSLNWSFEKARRYSSVASSAMVVPLNLIFLVGKLSNKIPTVVTQGALVGLSFTAAVALPYMIDQGVKYVGDFNAAYKKDMWVLALCSGLKALETFTNCGLVVGGCGASLVGLFGYAALQTTLYSFMMPVATAALVITFVMMFAYIVLNKKALEELNAQETLEITPLIRAIMDKDTLKEVLSKMDAINPENEAEVLKTVKENLTTQLKYVQGADLALKLLGFPLLAIQKYFTPNSAVNPAINLVVSLVYFIKTFVEKKQEAGQRDSFNAAIQSAAGSRYTPLQPI